MDENRIHSCDIEFDDEEDELDRSLLDFQNQNIVVETQSNSLYSENRHNRCIVHIDIDCFYAQVEMNKDPSLHHKPLGVKQKNLVVTTNYVARKAGVPKSCWIRDALKKCPSLILVNGEDLRDYRKVSQNIFDLLKTFGVPVERLGMDENFLDVTNLVERYHEKTTTTFEGHNCYENHSELEECKCGCYARLKIASRIAKSIRELLFRELSITSSAGVAHNKLLAKMVGSRHKPNDQTVLFPDDVHRFMLEVNEIHKIPGIGSSMCKILNEKQIHTIQQLQQADTLTRFLDQQTSQRLRQLSLGIDRSEVKQSVAPKSIGLEDRFKGLYTKEECVEKLRWLLNRLSILVHEDGRFPTVIKITARDYFKDKFIKKFHKESRQCKIDSNLFESLSSTCDLNTDAALKVEAVMIQLLQKMVNMDERFHLTLLGLSVSGLISQKNVKGSISSFFKQSCSTKKDSLFHAPETKISVDEQNRQPDESLPISLQQKKRIHSEDKTNDAFESHKRLRFTDEKPSFDDKKPSFTDDEIRDSLIPRSLRDESENQVDPVVFSQLPADIQNEICGTFVPTPPKRNQSCKVPDGWDRDVFNHLPQNIRQELLIQKDLETSGSAKTNNISSKVKMKTTRNIFNYFQKK